MKKSSKIILTIVIIALIAAIGGLGYYSYKLNKKVENLESYKKEDNKEDINNKEKEETKKEIKEKDKKITYTLFDKIYDISDICSRDEDCIKNLGKFSLGDNTYDFKVNLYNYESGKESSINISNKKINLEGYLSYIVKINNKLLIVQEFNGAPQAHINIYDENLNLIKTYTTNSTSNNYFEIYDNKFTYYKCDSDDFENQKLKKYKVSINNNDFNEEFESEKAIQCNWQD